MAKRRKAFTDMLDAAAVVNARLPGLWMLALDPTSMRQREAVRMVTEKQAALAEGAVAAAGACMSEGFRFWTNVLTGRFDLSDTVGAGHRVLAASLAPAQRKMSANRRRLGRRRKS